MTVTLAIGLLALLWAQSHAADWIGARLRVPASVLLVLLGGAWALTPIAVQSVARETAMTWLLAPLLFEGARAVDVAELRRDAGPVLSFACLGTLIAAAVIATTLVYCAHWPIASTLPLAAIIAATDPVAVIATFRAVGLGGRLLTLVESESLLNDAVAACLLSLVPLWLSPDGLAFSALAGLLATEVGLALVLGLIAGGVLNVLGPRLRHPPLESVLQLAAAIGMAHLAQLGHASPVVTTVVAGLVVAARRSETSTGHWDALLSYGHLSNTAIFLWIGWWGLPQLPTLIGPVTVVLLVIWAARAVAIYPLAGLFRGSSRPLPMAYQHILVVGSLRGALALALVLPTATAIGADSSGPSGDLLVAVVALSVILQGLAIQPLLRRLDLLPRRTVIA